MKKPISEQWWRLKTKRGSIVYLCAAHISAIEIDEDGDVEVERGQFISTLTADEARPVLEYFDNKIAA